MPKRGRTHWKKTKGGRNRNTTMPVTAEDEIQGGFASLHLENEVEQVPEARPEVISISDSSQEADSPIREVKEVLPVLDNGPGPSTRPPATVDPEIISISSDTPVDPVNSPLEQQPRRASPQPSPSGGDAQVVGTVSPPVQESNHSDDEFVAPPAKKTKTLYHTSQTAASSKTVSVSENGQTERIDNRTEQTEPICWWGERLVLPDSDDEDGEIGDQMRNAVPPSHPASDQNEPISPRAPPSPRGKWINTGNPDRRRVFGRVRNEINEELEIAGNEMVENPDFDMPIQQPNPEIQIDGNQDEPVISDEEEDDEPVVEVVPDNEIINDRPDQALIDGRIRELEAIRNNDPRRRRPSYLRATRPDEAEELNIGNLSERCNHCNARYFPGERTQRGTYRKCCNNGNVQLDPLHDHPDELKDLFTGANERWSAEFKNKIVTYNNLVAFASIRSERRNIPGRGPYVYAIQGQMYYHYSNINVNRENQQFGPVYILNPEEAAQQRFENGRAFNVQRPVLDILSRLLHRANPFAQQYRYLFEVYERQMLRAANENIQIPRPYLEFVAARDQRRNREFDLPQANEVAAIYRLDDDAQPNPDMRAFPRVFVRDQDDRFRQDIPILSEYCDPLAFPLLFPLGDLGWHRNIALRRPTDGRRTVTPCEYYAYRLADRHEDGLFEIMRYAGRLIQHYVVSAFLKIELQRLNYLRNNQDQLRADEYQGLADYLHNRAAEENIPVGRMIILPSTHPGSPRHQLQRFQDAMAIASAIGNPTFFVTMTCNPNWPEIRNQIPANDHPTNHPTLVARVFKEKLEKLIEEIKGGHVFGITKAYVSVIEFQKRGLPHAHILITVVDADRLQDGPSVDRFVCAEIPDPETEPELYRLVGMYHVHGPCGNIDPRSVCMVDGRCSKHYPMPFFDETVIGEGRIKYRRRQNGRRIQVTRNRRAHVVGNEFVVPYNKYLLLKYRTHINIEVVTGQMHYKYLYKYFFKNEDQAVIRIVEGEARDIVHDEIQNHIEGRCMTPPEAAWRILQFELYDNSHTIYRLPVHLPDRQNVVFRRGEEQVRVAQVHHTELTHWFEINRRHPEARRHLYAEFPLHYTWKKSPHYRWVARQRTTKPIVSRIYTVSLRYGELYYLRVLLLHVRGATSFEDLRTVNGVVLPTFREACEARGLLQEDREWRRALEEAAEREMPRRIRQMFAFILAYGNVLNAPDLWTAFRDVMIDDFLNRRHLPQREAEIRALGQIQRILVHNGRRLNEFGLEEPEELGDINAIDDPVDVAAERQLGDQMITNLNDEQRAVFDRVIAAVDDDHEERRLFYVSGAAGTGKTYLYNALITHLNGREQKVISIAWTGLAAALLKNGRTVHSRFQLSVPLLEDSTSGITGQSEAAVFLREAKLIIWDEVSMATRISFGIVDRTLRDLCGIDRPFGGKCVVVGGDFKQCLPVVPGGDRANIVLACVKKSRLWPLFEHIRLETNVRVRPEEVEFIQWLDRLGNGTLPTIQYGAHNNIVRLPDQCVVPTLDALIARVFGEIVAGNIQNAAILTPLNDTCYQINDRIVSSIRGVRERVYLSADSVDGDDALQAALFPVETLNDMKPSGLPPHRLLLKEGIVVMLLRNLNVRQNLCNGTRLIIRYLGVNYIRAEIINFDGTLSGTEVLIPRIDLKSEDRALPITLRRRQLPVRPCYAMTINKAQGQTFDKVGIHLPRPVFEHGQLYVAFSRARTVENVSICVTETAVQGKLVRGEQTTCTKNIVYREVL